MIRAAIFAAFVTGISAQVCVPPVITHPETTDELYRLLLSDLNELENKAAEISFFAQSGGTAGCTPFQNIDFFTQLLITITGDNTWLDKLGAGFVPSGNECIGVNLRIDFDLKNIEAMANTPVNSSVCPPTSGAALSQYTLQRFGRALDALSKAPAGPRPPGCYQKYVQDLDHGIAVVRDVIARNDVVNCVAATNTLAHALLGIRQSSAGTACQFPSATSPTSTMAYSG